MANYTDSVLELAVASEDCRDVEVCIGTVSVTALLGVGLTVIAVATATGTSTAGGSWYADLDANISAASTVAHSTNSAGSLSDSVAATSDAALGMIVSGSTSGSATSSAKPEFTVFAGTSVSVSGTGTPSSTRYVSATDRVRATSAVGRGVAETRSDSVTATSSLWLGKGAAGTLSSSVTATSAVAPSTKAALARGDSATATTTVTNSAVTNAVASDVLYLYSSTDFLNPLARAWVMNTETTAMSRYQGYDFESVTMHDGVLYGVNRDGVYRLNANTDAGVKIQTAVETGFMDFGIFEHKRIPNVYFGFRSDGQLRLTVQTMENSAKSYTYETPVLPAFQPVNTRLFVGKGLVSAYWKFTLSNRNGAYFDLDKWSVDVAVSPRRV